MSQSNNNSGRFTEQDIEAVRRGFGSDHGRYIALMDLSHFLSNDNVEALLPNAEVMLNRPLSSAVNPSMMELPTTSRNLDLDSLTPPPPPLPRMMKNLLKDRRRFQRQFAVSSTPQAPDFETEAMANAHKALENYMLKSLIAAKKRPLSAQQRMFATELIFATMTKTESDEDEDCEDCLRPEMEWRITKK